MEVRQSYITKYRPKRFENVIGQDPSTIYFRKAISKDMHPSGWLITGPYGLGKTTISRIYAKSVLCPNVEEDGNPCNQCDSCVQVDQDCNPNYIEIDAGSNSGVKEIQEILDQSRNLPLNGSKYKVIAIDECHVISKQAQIKLLKPVEDGISHLIMVFLTTDPDKLNDAFRSRLFRVDISVPDLDKVVEVLESICTEEGREYDKSVLETISRQSRGHFRDAVNSLEKYLSLGGDQITGLEERILKVSDLLLKIPKDVEGAIKIFQHLTTMMSSKAIWESMLEVLNNSTKVKYISSSFFSENEIIKYKEIEEEYTEKNLFGVYDFLLKQPVSSLSYGPLEQLVIMLHAYLKNRVVYSVEDHVEDNNNGFKSDHFKKSYNRKAQSRAEESVPLEEFTDSLKST